MISRNYLLGVSVIVLILFSAFALFNSDAQSGHESQPGQDAGSADNNSAAVDEDGFGDVSKADKTAAPFVTLLHGFNADAFETISNSWRPGYVAPLIEVMSFSGHSKTCLLYTSPSPRDQRGSRMPSSA